MHPEAGNMTEKRVFEVWDLYWKHVLPVHPVLQQMLQRGRKCAVQKTELWRSLLLKEAERIENDIKTGLNQPNLYLRSSKQLMDLLYNKLKLPVQRSQYMKTGQLRPMADAVAVTYLASIAPENAVLEGIVE